MAVQSPPAFGSWRRKFWPIHSDELRKFLPLLGMKFLVSLNYCILTCMKDAMVVTAQGSSAEVIPVLKGWIVLPIAFLVMLVYSKLSNHFKQTTLFYFTMGGFLSLILLIAFVLYPARDHLSPHASADALLNFFDGRFGHWIAVYRNWIPSFFFVLAELWGGLVIFILFWSFVNQISSVNEAKRTYTLYTAAGDIGTLLTGPVVWHFASRYAHLDFSYTLQSLAVWIVLFGLATMGCYFYLTRFVLTGSLVFAPQKNKLSLLQSLKYIAQSKYLLSIAIMVIGCGLSINMIEVSWKANLKLLHPETIHYQAYMGTVMSAVGLIALLTVFFIGGNTIRSIGWRATATLPPLILGFTGALFFVLLLIKNHLPPLLFGMTPLVLVVTVGAAQNIISKVMKYSFFDPTKEMAFIPLGQEAQTKGKAAIDIIGSRLGKSSAAWIQVGLIDLLGTSSVLSITHYLLPIVLFTIVAWILVIRYVNREFQEAQVET